jgi:hypothetical protein
MLHVEEKFFYEKHVYMAYKYLPIDCLYIPREKVITTGKTGPHFDWMIKINIIVRVRWMAEPANIMPCGYITNT